MRYRKRGPIKPPILTAGQALFEACQKQIQRQSIEVANADAKALAKIMNLNGEFQENLP